MVSRTRFSILLAIVALLSDRAVAQDRQTDDVTRKLFEQYVARQAKIDTESVMAATHLVAQRGRETGFWKDVLAELQRNNPHSEIGCVRVLGKMLSTDAAARDVIRRHQETGEVSAWDATVCLTPEVVTELIERGRKADRFRVDHYAIALARSRRPEASDFFKSILNESSEQSPFPATVPTVRGGTRPTPTAPAEPTRAAETAPVNPRHLESTRFHAAVGLAQLGDSEGIDWLIANCEREGSVMNAWPKGAPAGGNLNACCVESLRHLSREHARSSKTDWLAWSKSVDRKSLRDRAVVFGDP